MGVPMAIGAGIQAASSLYGAKQQSNAAKNAAGAANARYKENKAMGQGLMTQGPDQFTQGLLDFSNMAGPKDQTASTVDLSSIFGDTPNMNMGNDALMQILRADPSKQVNGAMDRLSGLADTNPYDTSGEIGALQGVDAINNQRAVNTLNAGVSGLGQRAGGAKAMAAASYLRGANADAGARYADINRQAYTSNQQLRLNALSTLGGLQDAATGRKLSAAEIYNRGQTDQAGLRLQGAQFNAGAQNTAAQNNVQNALAFMQQRLAALSGGASAEATRRGQNISIFDTIAGQPGPATPATGQVAGAAGDIGNLIMLLPYLQQLGKKAA